MNYETALALKNAGFDQFGNNRNIDGAKVEIEDCYIPTLEELIEAVGDDFSHLNRTNMGWAAFGDEGIFGSTPTEAVAFLWLALNNQSS